MKRVRRMYYRRIMTSRHRNDKAARDGVETLKLRGGSLGHHLEHHVQS
jgi:hypothetical protein